MGNDIRIYNLKYQLAGKIEKPKKFPEIKYENSKSLNDY